MALIAAGQLTIVDANDGLSASLSSNAAVLAADAAGAVASFAGAETQFSIREGGTDTTALWSYYVSALGGGITYRDSDDGADRSGAGAVAGGLGGNNLLLQSEAPNVSPWLGSASATATSETWGISTFFSVAKTLASTSEPKYQNVAVAAGTTLTASVAVMAGSASAVSFGMYDLSSWGGTGAALSIVSGPGTLTNVTGRADITGLSATEVTVIKVTRTFAAAGTCQFVIYPGSSSSTTIGASVKVAGMQLEPGSQAGEYAPTAATARSGTRGYVKVTGLTQDLSYLDITATRLGQQSITRRYSVAKARTGATGPDGQRGSITTSRAITGSVWTDAEAVTALTTLGASGAIAGDVVTLYNISAGFVQSRRYLGSAWQTVTAFFGGDAIVDQTIAGQKLADQAITAAQLAANAVTDVALAAGAVKATKLAIRKHVIY